jgi:aspartate oxidase
MGSLMAGWKGENQLKREGRQRSLTKDEIDNFWKSKNKERDEHASHLEELMKEQASVIREAALSELPAEARENMSESDKQEHVKDWWRRSQMAYLNEVPAPYKRGGNYKAQFDESNYSFESFGEAHSP